MAQTFGAKKTPVTLLAAAVGLALQVMLQSAYAQSTPSEPTQQAPAADAQDRRHRQHHQGDAHGRSQPRPGQEEGGGRGFTVLEVARAVERAAPTT